MAPLLKFAAAGVFAALVAAQDKKVAPTETKVEAPPAAKKDTAPPPAKKDTTENIPRPVKQEEDFIEVAPIAVCPDGSFSSSGCATVDTADATYSCPHPYKLDKKSNTCTATLFSKPDVTCPAGSIEHKGKCLTSETVPFELQCPKKTVESKGGCVEPGDSGSPDREVQPKYSCPKGTKLDGENCVASTKTKGVYSCDKGYELVKSKCVTRVSVPMTCEKGELHGDRCISTETVPKTNVCPKKANYEENGCATVETSAPSAVCDKGYVLTGKFCIRKLIISTSNAPPPVVESKGKKGEAPVAPPPAKKDESPSSFKCKYQEDEAGNCYTEEKVKPQPVCPKGADLKGKKCVSVEILPAESGCPKGYEEEKGGCVKVESFPAKCPKGYKPDDGQCWKTQSEAAAFSCPDGAADKKGCSQVVTVPAAVKCPKKADLDESGRCIQRGYSGSKSRIISPKKTCPKGYHQMSDGCVKDVSTEGDYVCDKGYTLQKKKCVSEHTIQPIMMCPKGYVSVKGGRCTRTTYEAPSFVCPEGSIGKGKKCYQAPERPSKGKGGKSAAPSPLKNLGQYQQADPVTESVESDFEPVDNSSVEDLGKADNEFLTAESVVDEESLTAEDSAFSVDDSN